MLARLIKKLNPMTPARRAQRKFKAIKLGVSDIAIDCGANVGLYTEYLGRTGATVYAFEPNPSAFRVLENKFHDNKNIFCINKGVLDVNTKMKLYLHENSEKDPILWSTGSSLLDFKGNILLDNYVEVEVIDLCEFISSLNARIRILKLDVEGVEIKILNKIIDLDLIEKIDNIFVEVHDNRVPELKEDTLKLKNLIRSRKINNINLDWG